MSRDMGMTLNDLHEPILPILRRLLADMPVWQVGDVLDLACGDTSKWPLYQAACGPATRLIGLDWERAVLPPAARGAALVVGSAQHIPFGTATFDGALCIAALGLFAELPLVLSELQRVLRPGAAVLFLTAERRWAEVRCWPEALAVRLAEAAGAITLPTAHADLTGDFETLLYGSGLTKLTSRAFLIEQQLPVAAAELALLPWNLVRPRLAAALSPAELATCDAIVPEIELCSVALACVAHRR